MNTLSIGVASDLKAGVNISKVFGGYFSNLEVAMDFVNFGISDIEKRLPASIKLADLGGGQGFLTKVVNNWLSSRGHSMISCVIDGNANFVETARKEGLEAIHSNLTEYNFYRADLFIMRAVNHYNSLAEQAKILSHAYASLKNDGFLVSQISSGSKENCELRSKICNLKSLGRSLDGENYHWTSVEEYIGLLKKAGFKENIQTGEAPSCKWTPEEMWDRFNSKETEEAKRLNDTKWLIGINERRNDFLMEAYDIINSYIEKFGKDLVDVSFDRDGKAVIGYKYPIIRSRPTKTKMCRRCHCHKDNRDWCINGCSNKGVAQ